LIIEILPAECAAALKQRDAVLRGTFPSRALQGAESGAFQPATVRVPDFLSLSETFLGLGNRGRPIELSLEALISLHRLEIHHPQFGAYLGIKGSKR
jgi:hypothetical protein